MPDLGYAAILAEDTIVVVVDGKPHVCVEPDQPTTFGQLLESIENEAPVSEIMKFFPTA